MVSTALICLTLLAVGQFGLRSCSTVHACTQLNQLLKAGTPGQGRLDRDGHFRPFTSCKSVGYSSFGRSCSSERTLQTAVTMQCMTKGGTESWAKSSAGTGVAPRGSAGTSSTSTSANTWTMPSLQNGPRPWPPTTRPRRHAQQEDSIFFAATAPGCSGPSSTRSSWENNARDFEEHERRVVDNILARYIFEAAHLQRLDLGRLYSSILPVAQRRLWVSLLERYDQGLDADSTSGSSSSSKGRWRLRSTSTFGGLCKRCKPPRRQAAPLLTTQGQRI